MPTLLSIQVSPPRTMTDGFTANPDDRSWTSGIFKQPVEGPVRLGFTNLEGDGQADTRFHGGPSRPVLAYSAGHYPAWREELDRPDFPHGAFGENFTVEGLDEDSVCLGDTYLLGDSVRLQVSQPRQPCWKLARKWQMVDLTDRVKKSGRTGWYLRVLEEGMVAAGMPLELVERPHPEWTITRAHRAMDLRKKEPETVRLLLQVQELSPDWQNALRAALGGS
jgi:MOSC domain-containing protein YiiM